MILDSLKNLKSYEALNANFGKAIEFILGNDLSKLPLGRNEICGDLVYANVMELNPKSKEEARIEIHRRYIDIQIPVTADEIMGYTPIDELPSADFNEADDYALYPEGLAARDYFNVRNDQFAIFFPQDGHAPAIISTPQRKVVVKVLCDK